MAAIVKSNWAKFDTHRVRIVDGDWLNPALTAVCICGQNMTVQYRYQLQDRINAHYAKYAKSE